VWVQICQLAVIAYKFGGVCAESQNLSGVAPFFNIGVDTACARQPVIMYAKISSTLHFVKSALRDSALIPQPIW